MTHQFNNYFLSDAQQSNFRVISLLTEQLMPLLKDLPQDRNGDISKVLVQILAQANYTGRCLGGALTPNGSLHTDQRDNVERAVKIVCDVQRMTGATITTETDKTQARLTDYLSGNHRPDMEP